MIIYPIFLPHAACPQHCVYCDQTRLSGVETLGDWESFSDRLEQMLPQQGRGEIAFYGGSFTLLPPDLQVGLLEKAASFVAQGRCSGIRLSTHPLGLKEKHLRILEAFPVTTVEVGCQSLDDEVLKAAGRGHAASETLAGLHRLLQKSWNVVAQLMPGLPGADESEAEYSLHTVVQAGVCQVRLYPLVVLEGTALAGMYRQGHYHPWSLARAVNCCARLWRYCLRSGVRVLRMGLPPLEEPPVAGPWHPAFGQLVRSRLWSHALAGLAARTRRVVVQLNPADLSDATGYRRENMEHLAEKGVAVRLDPDMGVPRFSFRAGGVMEKLANIEVPA